MSEIPDFFKEIQERVKLQFKPLNHLYIAYLIFFVFIIGGLGIWITLYQESKDENTSYFNVTLNIGTYYLVMIVLSYIDIVTNEKIVNKKSLQVYSMILLITIGTVFVSSIIAPPIVGITLAIIGVIIGLFIWHLANCDNDKFNDVSYSAKIKNEASSKHGQNWNNE